MDAIFKRRSIRKYTENPVEKDKIEKLLRAAMQAPSARNQQPWEFIVVENRETLDKMALMGPASRMLAQAPLGFVLLGNKQRLLIPGYWEQDMGAALQNILLQAVELGLGAVWLGVHPTQDRVDYLQKLFQLPENMMPFAMVSVGYPADENKFVDRFDQSRIHYENY